MDANWKENKFSDLFDNNYLESSQNTKANKRKYNTRKQLPLKSLSQDYQISSKLTPDKIDNSCMLWSEIYKPSCRDELIISKVKIKEFEKIITLDNKIIIIRGPTGCGKHCLVNFISSELNIQIIKWENDDINVEDQSNHTYKKFKNYIRSASYNQIVNLNFTQNTKFLLIDDIPFYFLKNPIEFIAIIREFSTRLVHKILLVVTIDNHLCPVSRFFSDILNSPSFNQLKPIIFNLNKIPKTGFVKLFKIVAEKEFKICKKVKIKADDLKELIIICDGDARFFLNSIQFLLLKSYSTSLDINEINFVNHIKDCSLGIFHYTGKIFYAKRNSERNDSSLLSKSLQCFSRNELLLDINDFVSSLSISPIQLIYNLHQNCVQFVPSINILKDLTDFFSLYDVQSSFWTDNNSSQNLLKLDNVNLTCRAVVFYNSQDGKDSFEHKFLPLCGSKIYGSSSQCTKNIQIINQSRFIHSHLSYKANVLDYSYYLTDTQKIFDMEPVHFTQAFIFDTSNNHIEENSINSVKANDSDCINYTDDDIQDFDD